MGGLSCFGLLWLLVSFLATFFLAGGCLVPEWLVGKVTAGGRTVIAFFGAYKRCNYPIYDDDSSMIALVEECGRYSSLTAVPSLYWRLTIVFVLTGTALSMLILLLLVASLCTHHVVNANSAVIFGFFQIVAAVFISAGLVVYPLGWDNAEVRGACGRDADRYNLGDCGIGRAFLAMCGGCGLLITAGLLSLCGGRRAPPPAPPRNLFMDVHHQNTFIRGYDQPKGMQFYQMN